MSMIIPDDKDQEEIVDAEELLDDPEDGEAAKEPAKEEADAGEKPDAAEASDEKDSAKETAKEDDPDAPKDKGEFLKRLKKETWQRREAERQRDEAVEYARRVNEERNKERHASRQITKTYVEESTASVDQLVKAAEQDLLRAHEAADAEKMVAAQSRLTDLAIRKREVAERQARLKEIEEREKAEPTDTQTFQPKRGPDQRTLDWVSKNPWYQKDEVMTAAAWAIHQKLAREGVYGNTESYWERLDAGMRDSFPHKYAKPNSKPTVVAAVSRKPATKPQRSSTLTDSQKAVAKRLGVTEQQYLEELNKEIGS